MRRRHSSHTGASPGAEASVKAARSLRAAQRAKRLDGRWNGGHFATDADGIGLLLPLQLAEVRHQRIPVLSGERLARVAHVGVG